MHTLPLTCWQVGPFPSPELLDITHNVAYVQSALQEMQSDSAKASTELMASLGGTVLSVDAGIKNAKKVFEGGTRAVTAIHTVMNEHNQVLGQYCGSNSCKELLPAFLDLNERFSKLEDQVCSSHPLDHHTPHPPSSLTIKPTTCTSPPSCRGRSTGRSGTAMIQSCTPLSSGWQCIRADIKDWKYSDPERLNPSTGKYERVQLHFNTETNSIPHPSIPHPSLIHPSSIHPSSITQVVPRRALWRPQRRGTCCAAVRHPQPQVEPEKGG
jgi:hypothetical protein